jgi:hypothetical protein
MGKAAVVVAVETAVVVKDMARALAEVLTLDR